jgi:hypothetical protein
MADEVKYQPHYTFSQEPDAGHKKHRAEWICYAWPEVEFSNILSDETLPDVSCAGPLSANTQF